VFMARSSPPGLFNVNNLAGNLFLKKPAHIPPTVPVNILAKVQLVRSPT